MEVKAVTKYVRIAPKKVRDLTREIQGKPVSEALNITEFSERKAAFHVGKTLKSAIANAEHNNGASVDDLVVKLAVVEDGADYATGMVWCPRYVQAHREADQSYPYRGK